MSILAPKLSFFSVSIVLEIEHISLKKTPFDLLILHFFDTVTPWDEGAMGSCHSVKD